MKKIKSQSLLTIAFFLIVAFVGAPPMIMGHGTDGGGGGVWTSASWIVTDSTTATWTGSAYTSGNGYIRYAASAWNSDTAGGYLKFRKSFTATDSSVFYRLDYQWTWYCNADGFIGSVYIFVYDGVNLMPEYTHWIDGWTKDAGSGPLSDTADHYYTRTVLTNSGHTYWLEVRVTIGSLHNNKGSSGYFCRSSSQLTTSSSWGFIPTITL